MVDGLLRRKLPHALSHDVWASLFIFDPDEIERFHLKRKPVVVVGLACVGEAAQLGFSLCTRKEDPLARWRVDAELILPDPSTLRLRKVKILVVITTRGPQGSDVAVSAICAVAMVGVQSAVRVCAYYHVATFVFTLCWLDIPVVVLVRGYTIGLTDCLLFPLVAVEYLPG